MRDYFWVEGHSGKFKTSREAISKAKEWANKQNESQRVFRTVHGINKNYDRDYFLDTIYPDKKYNPPRNKWIPTRAVRFLKGGIIQVLK
jgi:hypothetical protein